MSKDIGRVPDGTGLSSSTEPQSSQGLGPSGFDPSRETFETVRAWCDETFGPATPESIINRAWEEWREMLDAEDDASRTIEAVDVVIILCRMPGFVEAFQRKMAINRARKWRLTGNGTGYHIPSDSDGSPKGGDAEGGSVEDDSAGRRHRPNPESILQEKDHG